MNGQKTELKIYFKDESRLLFEGDVASSVFTQLCKFSRTGFPIFFEGEGNTFYSSETVDSFKLEEADKFAE